jgi:hypothetical protein
MKKSRKFEYQARDRAAVTKRANQSSGRYDSMFKGDFSTWTPKEGTSRVRFLPPTWDEADHFGLDIFVHYGVGSDEQSYLCLQKMKEKDCPVCEEKSRAAKAGDTDYANKLSPIKRVLVWMIDRDDEDAGPQLWAMAWTNDKEITGLMVDERTGKVLNIDHHEHGYDVSFKRKGTKRKTQYTNFKIERDPSPLCDDEDKMGEWLDFASEHPLPSVLQYYEAEYIAGVATTGGKESDEEEEEEKPRKKRPRDDDDDEDEDEDTPRNRSGKKVVDDDDDDEEEEKPRKKRPQPTDDDDDDEEDKPRKKVRRDEEEDDDDEESRPTRTRTKMTSRSDDDDDDDEDDPDCIACGDTGRNSKGGFCVCAKGRRLAKKARDDDDD